MIRNSHMKVALFDAAIELARKRIDENYKVAVPQYYSNKIQLLLPMYLTNPSKPDLALTLTRDDVNKCYLGRTCITMEWAYNNARLIAKPNSDWLLPNDASRRLFALVPRQGRRCRTQPLRFPQRQVATAHVHTITSNIRFPLTSIHSDLRTLLPSSRKSNVSR